MGKILSFTSGKGGVGKTFCAVNTAVELAERGFRVLVIDMDINCSNVFILLHVKPENRFQRYFENVIPLADTIITSDFGVDVISAGVNILGFIQFENEYNFNRLVRDLEVIKENYDFVVIDHAAGIRQELLKFYQISDEIVFIANPEVTALTDLYRVIKVVSANKLCGSLNLLVNRVKNIDWAVNLYREIQAVMKKFGIPEDLHLLGPIVNDEEKVMLSIQKRTPLVKLFPRTPIKGGFALATTRLLYKMGMFKDSDGGQKAFSKFF
ncbi:MAG: AAA family ATPase [Spirochaetes bacterium]|nr:AAA family ATPase [Spirochaetota bacterium]